MGTEPTSEAWEAWNQNLKAFELAALSRPGPEPKDEPRKLDSIVQGRGFRHER
jgi:hypothetical protein